MGISWWNSWDDGKWIYYYPLSEWHWWELVNEIPGMMVSGLISESNWWELVNEIPRMMVSGLISESHWWELVNEIPGMMVSGLISESHWWELVNEIPGMMVSGLISEWCWLKAFNNIPEMMVRGPVNIWHQLSYYNLSLTDVRTASSRPLNGRPGPNWIWRYRDSAGIQQYLVTFSCVHNFLHCRKIYLIQ